MPLATPLSTFFIDTYGLSSSVKTGVFLSIIGAWNRLFINDFLEIIIIATLFSAVGGPLIFNAKTKLTANWYPSGIFFQSQKQILGQL